MVATPQYKPPAQRVLASAPNQQVPLWGITLAHSRFSRTHWLVNRPNGMALTLESGAAQFYEASYFELTLPNMDSQGQQDAQLSLQNIDRIIVDELELAATLPSERITVTLRLFIEDQPGAGPQNVPLQLSFASVQATSQTVTGTAGRPDTLNRAFPVEVYRIDHWPGLDR
jgi:hypothetical protein